jgi:mRNA interferase MazF
MVTKGDIVLVKFPFSDLSQTKPRPAVILWINPAGDDITLCAITSQNMDQLSIEDIPVLPADPEFPSTGLRVPSKIRTTRIATLTKQLVIRKFGTLGTEQMQALNEKLIEMLQLT